MRRHGEIPARPHRRDPATGHRVGSRRARRLAPLVLSGAAAVSLAACSPSSSSSPSRAAAARGSTTTAPTTTATTASTTSTTAAGPGDCTSAQLAVSAGPGRGATGHSEVTLLFKNTGSTTCRLHGYPGVAGLDAAGKQVTQAQRTPEGFMGGLSSTTAAPPTVTLTPGQTASAIVEGTDVPQGGATSCPTLAGMLVTAPNTTHAVHFSEVPGDCSGLQVHPVVPGTSGSVHP